MSSVVGIATSYLLTLKNQQTKGLNKGAVFTQFGLPTAAGILCFIINFSINSPDNAISGISIVSALLCAVATMLFQIRVTLKSNLESGREHFATKKDLELIDGFFASVVWAITFGLFVVALMVALEWFGVFQSYGSVLRFSSAVLVAFIVHFITVIGTALKRLNRVYELVAMQKR